MDKDKDKDKSAPSIFRKPSEQEIVMTRIFDAPRERLFEAYTDPSAIPRWWGLGRFTTSVDVMDVRPGGIWRFVQHDPDGNEYAFNGEYREVIKPERLTHTFEFEGTPGHVLLETVTFEEDDGKTKVTATTVFQTVEDRDGMLKSGMEDGAAESMDRLAEYLASMP
jgi:uncharacterized protein YndB with AHSA1/START domain